MLKILVVDDEKQEREGIANLIRSLNFELEVRLAASGEQAADILDEEEFDILMTDIRMSRMNGVELMRYARALSNEMVFIVYSAYGEFEYAQSAMKLGAVRYLLKPIEVEAFTAVMEEVILHCRTREEQKMAEQLREEELLQTRAFRLEYDLLRLIERGSDLPTVIARIEEKEVDFRSHSFVPVNVSFLSGHLAELWESFWKRIEEGISYKLLCLNREDEHLLLFIFDQDEKLSEAAIADICERIITLANDEFGVRILMVAGERCDGLKMLPQAMEGIERCTDLRFYLSQSQVVFAEQHQEADSGKTAIETRAKNIYEEVRHGNLTAAQKAFDPIFAEIARQKSFSSFYTKFVFTDILKNINEILGHSLELEDIVVAVHYTQNFAEMKEVVLSLWQRMLSGRKKSESGNRVVKMCKTLIFENYSNPSLGLAFVAEKLHITPAYLSALFRQDTGVTLTRFITEYRLMKAKEMLYQTNLKISEICRKVGYENQSYFGSLFRSHCGLSPAQYRENRSLDETESEKPH